MYVVAVTSFGVRTLDGGFNWLHGLSLLTLGTVTLGLVAAVQRRIPSHRAFMQGSYFGVLGAFIGVIAAPERRIPLMAAHDLPLLAAWAAALALTAVLTVVGATRFSHPRPSPTNLVTTPPAQENP